MKVAYLVLAHENAHLLKRSLANLSCSDSAFFVHIDAKSDLDEFRTIAADNVFLSRRRIPVYWGEFSQVDAILLMLREALDQPVHYDYFVLISGSDYPLRSGRYIQAFLALHQGLEFMNLVKMPNEAAGKPLDRINTLRIDSSRPVRRFAVRALAKIGLARRDYRKYLGGLDPYSGSTWWALTREACEYILGFMSSNQHVEKYFRSTFAPDEAFLHTILGNSCFADHVRRNLLYEDWSSRGPHPGLISERDVQLFESNETVTVNDVYGSGEVLFARKFAASKPDLLRRMDEIIQRKDRSFESEARPFSSLDRLRRL